MPLTDLIGQDLAVRVLRGILRRGAVAHAYLFAGEDGVGKTLAAREFARALLCELGGDDACGRCRACRRAAEGNHPDLRTVAAGERQIRIDQVREIAERLAVRAYEGGRKVVLVERADEMNPAAANAFLKTLEEPPPLSVLILVSARPDLLPETIRSRVQRIAFRPLPRAELTRRVAVEFPDSAEIRAALADGRLSVALDPGLEERRDLFFSQLERMQSGAAEADEIWKDRAEMEAWFDQAVVWARDLLVLASGRPEALAHPDRAEELRRAARGLPVRRIADLLGELFRLRDALRFNLNRQITFHHVMMQLRSVLR